MATAKEATVANTSEYRVVVAAVTYTSPEPGFAPDGSETTLPVYKVGRFGETVELTDVQAKRLGELGPLQPDGSRGPAVKPVDEPLSYDEKTVDELKELAETRGIEVTGSGANGAALKEDYVNALVTYDQGQGAAA